jgi:hypothetical protein
MTRAARSFPATFGYGAGLAVVLAAFESTGGTLWGYKEKKNLDKYEELERLRTAYRQPAEKTFAELGEGRGKDLQALPTDRRRSHLIRNV